jgi:hypothetical protein
MIYLTDDWKIFTNERLEQFRDNIEKLLKLHGEDICNRLQCFYSSIAKLFQGNNVGSI